MKSISKTLMISNKLGLHARASAVLVKTASQFRSEITLTAKRQSANAKSIMGILMLAAAKGTKLTVKVEGDDAEDALAALEKLIQNKFGEE